MRNDPSPKKRIPEVLRNRTFKLRNTMILYINSKEKTIVAQLPAAPYEVRTICDAALRSRPAVVSVIDVSSQVGNLADHLSNVVLEYDTIDKFNTLAEKIGRMNPWKQWTFSGALSIENVSSLDQALYVADHLENYTFIPKQQKKSSAGTVGVYTVHGYVQRRVS